jgi:carnitine 3-dehydrogenase
LVGSPESTGELRAKLIDGVHTEAGSRTIADLEAERDELLPDLIELRSLHG